QSGSRSAPPPGRRREAVQTTDGATMTASASDVKRWAAELEFAACGITTPSPSSRPEMLDRWLERGYGGTMRYLHRQARKRKAPQLIDDRARPVVVVLENYYYPEPAATVEHTEFHAERDSSRPKVAKYARGMDYHPVMQARLGRLAGRLLAGGASLARVYADAGPVPERELAERAGLGWI